ncbi:MAG: hypothetical protein M3265_02460, partial [Actinomycetota bacterium]|nr:hypothetical protein [Actinomycetota bacterium]
FILTAALLIHIVVRTPACARGGNNATDHGSNERDLRSRADQRGRVCAAGRGGAPIGSGFLLVTRRLGDRVILAACGVVATSSARIAPPLTCLLIGHQ